MMDESIFCFQTLLPDTILNAIEGIGVRVASGLTELNSYENRVYQFLDEDRQGWVVKFYRPERWSREQILEEHAFSSELAAADLPVVAPSYWHNTSLHIHDGFMFALYPRKGGRAYEMDSYEHLEGVGRLLGRLHTVGRESAFVHRPQIGLQEYLYQPREILLNSSLLPNKLHTAFATALDDLIQATEKSWQSQQQNWQPCRLHGDCHPGNILWRDGPLLVDFDDARSGPVVQDLWMLLHGSRAEQQIQLDILLDAYSEFGEFNLTELGLIEPLRSMRMVYYLSWVVRRWQDAAFPKSFPWMKESEFWQQQTTLFSEQVKAVYGPSLTQLSMY